MSFVEEEVTLSLLTKLCRQRDGCHDCMAWFLPCATLAACVYYWPDHVQSNFVKASSSKDFFHLRGGQMPPSQVQLPEFLLHYGGIPRAQVLEADLYIKPRPVR